MSLLIVSNDFHSINLINNMSHVQMLISIGLKMKYVSVEAAVSMSE